MNAALWREVGSIGICQNPEAKSKVEKIFALACPIVSKTHSRRGSGCDIDFVIVLKIYSLIGSIKMIW